MEKTTRIGALIGTAALAAGIIFIAYKQHILYGYGMIGLGIILWILFAFFNREHLARIFSRRTARYGANVTVMILVFTAIIIVVQVLANRHDKMFDLTKHGSFTLSPQTVKILENLDREVKAIAFTVEGQANYFELKDLLALYKYHSDKFDYEFVDGDLKPQLAQHYGVDTHGTTVIESGVNYKKVSSASENQVTSAILEVTKDTKKKIYFLKGHNERSITETGNRGYSGVENALLKDNYEVEEIALSLTNGVPEDCSVLVVPGPEAAFYPEEAAFLIDYVNRGGRLMVMHDYKGPEEVSTFLGNYGLEFQKDVIIEPLSQLFGGDAFVPVVESIAVHPIFENYRFTPVFAMCRSVAKAEDISDRIQVTALLHTSQDSWAETNLDKIEKEQAVEFNEGEDMDGPIPIAAAVTIALTKFDLNEEEETDAEEQDEEAAEEESADEQPEEARLVVIGDADFASNNYLYLPGNKDLFLNSVAWLAEQEELISVRADQEEAEPIFLSAFQAQISFWVPVVLIPFMIIGIGIMVITQRRRSK